MNTKRSRTGTSAHAQAQSGTAHARQMELPSTNRRHLKHVNMHHEGKNTGECKTKACTHANTAELGMDVTEEQHMLDKDIRTVTVMLTRLIPSLQAEDEAAGGQPSPSATGSTSSALASYLNPLFHEAQ